MAGRGHEGNAVEDFDAIHRWMDTPDFVLIPRNARPGHWEQVRDNAFEEFMAMQPGDEFELSLESVRVKNDVATVPVRIRVLRKRLDDGFYGQKGKQREITVTVRARDVWLRSSDGWKRKSREIVGAPEFLVDGEPFTPSGRAIP